MADVKNNEKIFIEKFTEFLKQYNYKKNGMYWRLEKDNTMFLFNLQKSQWGPQFYINFGIFFRELGDKKIKIPKSYEWHFEHRLERILNLSQEEFLKLFSLDIEEKKLLLNIKEICENIRVEVFPLLEKFSNYEHLSKDDLDFEGFWLANISKNNLKQFALKKLKKSK